MSYPRTALISDLHANLPALETALADARARGIERYVCLGDVIGYGAEPRACLDLVMELCGPEPHDRCAPSGAPALQPGLCLLGNHEYALLHSSEDFNPKARAALDWTRVELLRGQGPRQTDYFDYLDGLEPSARDERALFVHGSPRDPVREYLLPRDAANPGKMSACFQRMDRPVCFVGHSHVPAIYSQAGGVFRPKDTEGPYRLADANGSKAIVNVGSIGQPRDGDPRLSYVVFDGESVTFVRLEYDHELAASRIRAVEELPDFLAERLGQGR